MTSLGSDQTTALRRLLAEQVDESALQRSPHPAGRRPRRSVLAGLVAVPLTAALVIGVVVLSPNPERAQASDALRGAAQTSITASDPVVAPGQFVKITTEAAYLAYEMDATGDYSAYLSPSVTEVFIPSAPGEEWVQRRTAQPATEFYGDASRAAAALSWAAALENGIVTITRDPDGDFVHAAELGGEREAARMPSDAEGALAFLRERSGGDGTDAGALGFAAELLREGTMTAAERATLYRALALLPGIRITDGSATLNGRTGTAFSLDGDVSVPEIIVDPETGQFIGERTLTPADLGPIPAGTVETYTAVTVTVVDSAP